MKLSDLGEFGLIEKIRKSSVRSSSSVLIGIGDDAAALKLSAAAVLLATTDLLLEGVHFDLRYTDFYSLGWKSAAVNLSDIAAMGGVPRHCLTSLGLPPSVSVEQVSDYYRGLNALLRAHRTVLAGGDTCASRQGMTASVVMLGETKKKQLITRSGARQGDRIFVTGSLGDSAAGLELLKAGFRVRGPGARRKSIKSAIRTSQSAIRNLIRRHLRPVPRVEWGRTLALSNCANAMIDISDGLSSDLSHVCEQSRVGAVVHAEKIPLSPSLRSTESRLDAPALHYALSGGEDYELLFTVPPAKMKKLLSLDIVATEIGVITGDPELLITREGTVKPLRPTGYNHFARARRAGKA
jgi:thiamine-monophosphate kinase